MRKQMTIHDFLTDDEIRRARELYQKLKGSGRFATEVARELIGPNMGRINAALGQENSARYLAYAVEHVFNLADLAERDIGR